MSTDVPENAPENCPGTQSESAGKSKACEGCPNQKICSSGEGRQVDPDAEAVQIALSLIKHKLLVLSGKGGVGKSTFSSQLSLALALEESQLRKLKQYYANPTVPIDSMEIEDEDDNSTVTQVGVLDIDLCGPSIPRMFGLEGQILHQSYLGWEPAYYKDNLAVVSIGFMLPNEDDAVIWRGPKKNSLIKQFLKDVYWGDTLDYLVIDTPPGTTDEHITIVNYLKTANLDGAIIVTTPQDVACIDVRREINFCKKVNIPILGVVENMSGFVCQKCKTQTDIFKATSGGGEALAKHFNIPFLGKIPLDPIVMDACENGKSILVEAPQSPASKALFTIVENIKQQVIKQ